MPQRRNGESALSRREFICRMADLGLAASGAGALLALSSCSPKKITTETSSTMPFVKPSTNTTSATLQASETTSQPSANMTTTSSFSTTPISTPGISTTISTSTNPLASSTLNPSGTNTTPSTPPITNPEEEPLPQPVATSTPVELCLNSRYSKHTLTGTASTQQIANFSGQ